MSACLPRDSTNLELPMLPALEAKAVFKRLKQTLGNYDVAKV